MSIGLAQRRLQDSVAALVDPVISWSGGRVMSTDSLYSRVRGALTKQSIRSGGRGAPQRSAPCAVDCLDWLRAVDRDSRRMIAGVAVVDPGSGTETVLRVLAGESFGPEQTGMVLSFVAALQRHARSGAEIAGDNPVRVPLRKPCPQCSSLWHRSVSGVRSWALVASEHGARCSECSATWTTQQFGLLAAMLEQPV